MKLKFQKATPKAPLALLLVGFSLLVPAFAINSKGSVFKEDISRCHGLKENSSQCWEDLLVKSSEQSLEKTFDLLGDLYQTEPTFAANCHAYTHKLGGIAYRQFSKHQNFKVTSTASACGFGFYHGFMETLVSSGADIHLATQFCSSVDQELKEDKKASSSCFHGIGHGVSTPHDPALYGRPKEMVAPAISLCHQAATSPHALDDCLVGAYAGIATFSNNNEYGLSVDSADPLGFCRQQLEENQETCYAGMVITLSRVATTNFRQAAAIISAIPNVKYAARTIGLLSGPVIYADSKRTDYTSSILDCQTLKDPLRLPCLRGFTSGLVEFNGPEKGPLSALNFCRTPALKDVERDDCFQYNLTTFRSTYSSPKFQGICREVEPAYQKYCSQS
jgi:hypothetical protein